MRYESMTSADCPANWLNVNCKPSGKAIKDCETVGAGGAEMTPSSSTVHVGALSRSACVPSAEMACAAITTSSLVVSTTKLTGESLPEPTGGRTQFVFP